MTPSKQGKKLFPGMAARILMGVTAFILSLCATLTCVCWMGMRLVKDDSIKQQVGSACVSRQLEYIGQAIDASAAAWHYDPACVKALVDRETLSAYQREIIAWYDKLLDGQVAPMPAWDLGEMVDAIRTDELFMEHVPALDRRSVARDNVAAALAQTIERAVFPLRYQLVMIGADKVNSRISIPALLQKASLAPWLLLAACLILGTMIVLLSLRRVSCGGAFIAAALIASAIMQALLMLFVALLGVPAACGAISVMLSYEVAMLEAAAAWRILLMCAAMALAGALLIRRYQRDVNRLSAR